MIEGTAVHLLVHCKPDGVEGPAGSVPCPVGISNPHTAPEFFLEAAFRDSKPFAVLSVADNKVMGGLTGISDGPPSDWDPRLGRKSRFSGLLMDARDGEPRQRASYRREERKIAGSVRMVRYGEIAPVADDTNAW